MQFYFYWSLAAWDCWIKKDVSIKKDLFRVALIFFFFFFLISFGDSRNQDSTVFALAILSVLYI